MKKIISMAIALIMAVNVNAQEGYEDTKHEVSIALGIEANSQWIDDFETGFTVLSGYRCENEKYMEPISAEYFYHINKWLGIGSIFVYGKHKQELYDISSSKHISYDDRVAKRSYNYYTLLPTVKFNFVRKKNFGLYSKAGLGVTYRTESMDYDDGSEDYDEKDLLLNWQLSLIGVEAGSPYMRAFAELGFGEQGIVCAGLRYKF